MSAPLDRLTAAHAERYAIDHEIGRGGMPAVYRDPDLKHKRDGTIGVLRSELARSVAADRVLRESHTEARLKHPQVLQETPDNK